MDSGLVAQRLRVTELLLESVADPTKLQTALHAMTAMMGADIGLLASGQRSNGSVRGLIASGHGLEPEQAGDLHFASFSFYRRWGLMQPAGKLYRDREILRLAGELGADRASMPQLDGGEHCMAHIDTGADRVCYVGFARLSRAQPFAPLRVQATESLLPHLRTAYAANRQFESFKAVSEAAMNRYERYYVGVVLVDEDGLVLYRNEPARQLFEQSDGLQITADGRIAACNPAETTELAQAIHEHLDSEVPDSHFATGLLKVSRPGNAQALSLAISPYRGGADHLSAGHASGNAVIMIYNPDRPPVERGSVVSQVFDLSPQESQLVCAIAAGDSLEDIARDSSRSLEAIRSQLKRIFRKTGTSRQTELVKLVLSGPAAMVQ